MEKIHRSVDNLIFEFVGHTPSFRTFLISEIFQMSGGWFLWHLKGGVYTPHKSRGVFSDILAMASRLSTLYGLKTWYVQSSGLVGIMKKVLIHIQHFWRIYDITNVGFFVILQFLATASVIKFVGTLEFHIEYVFW